MILGRSLLRPNLLVSRLRGGLLPAALLLVGMAGVADAADRCLTRSEQRAKTAAHAVIPLSRAMQRVQSRGEVIHARLCERDGHLLYLLTVLGPDGKVAQASVDAANGAPPAAHAHETADHAHETVDHAHETADKDSKKGVK